jgi:exonuclease III/ribonuclease HI
MACKILHWNAAGIKPKLPEFRQWVADHSYDIICLQETKLSEKWKLNLPGYSVVRKDNIDGLKASRGLATLIRDNLSYTVLEGPAGIECQVINIAMARSHMTVVNVYLPPFKTVAEEPDRTAFSRLFDHNNCVIMGDINARSLTWGSSEANQRGLMIESVIEEKNFVVLNSGKPTHYWHVGPPSHIDVSLTSACLATRCCWNVLDDLMGSDHTPIEITLDVHPDHKTTSLPRWKYAKADWHAFRTTSGILLSDENTTDSDVDVFSDNVSEAIIKAAEVTVPQTKARKGTRVKPLPYWNDEIKDAISARNRAQKRWQNQRRHNRSDSDESLYVEYKRLRAVAQRTIRETAKRNWEKFCSSMTTQTRLSTVWRMAKRMDGAIQHVTGVSLKDKGKPVDRDSDKAELLAQQFASVSSSQNYSAKFRDRLKQMDKFHPGWCANNGPDTAMSRCLNAELTLEELKLALYGLRKKTAPGADRVSNEFLLKIPVVGLMAILRLFNLIWKTGRLPRAWKHSIVQPILKPGKDPHVAASYRPISLTSTLCKLMERVINARLTWYLEKFSLLSNVQSGFRRHRSTIDQIARLQDAIVRQLGNEGYVMAVFIDLEKAFDMINKNVLMHKLKIRFGVNGRMFAWIDSFLSDRTIQVRVGDQLSDVITLENGSAQGANISPTLFTCMEDDLPEHLAKNPLTAVDASLFADDGLLFYGGKILSAVRRRMQLAVDEASKWYDENGFLMSEVKTVSALFTHRTPAPSEYALTINGKPLKIELKVKYLGLIFDHGLSWNEHIQYTVEKCKKRLNLMRAVSGRNWGASTKTLLQIYRVLIRSVVDYGSVAIDSASGSALSKLDVIQNKALTICCGAMKGTAVSALQVECGEPPLYLRRLSQQIKFAIKVKATQNHVAKPMFEPQWTDRGDRFTDNRCPMAVKVGEFFERNQVEKVFGPTWPDVPPWKVKLPGIDTDLVREVSKHNSPAMLLAIAKAKIAEFDDYVHIYTDASRTPGGEVGIGCVIRINGFEHRLSQRLTDGVSVYTGELSAITLAFSQIKARCVKLGHRRFVIFSDSLSVLRTLENGRCRKRPYLFSVLLHILGTIGRAVEIKIVWVPSHIGIQGNETADLFAGRGAALPAVTTEIGLELHEAYSVVDRHIVALWQSEWTSSNTGSHLRRIQPTVGKKSRLVFRSRRTETLSHRLRLGMCWLNACLSKIGVGSTNLCRSCQTPETVEHYLLECTNNVTDRVKQKCKEISKPLKLECVLNSCLVLQTISDACDRKL